MMCKQMTTRKFGFWKPHFLQAEAVKEAKLVQAEADLRDLKGRAARAMQTLDERHKRNHWRESIEQMITGAY